MGMNISYSQRFIKPTRERERQKRPRGQKPLAADALTRSEGLRHTSPQRPVTSIRSPSQAFPEELGLRVKTSHTTTCSDQRWPWKRVLNFLKEGWREGGLFPARVTEVRKKRCDYNPIQACYKFHTSPTFYSDGFFIFYIKVSETAVEVMGNTFFSCSYFEATRAIDTGTRAHDRMLDFKINSVWELRVLRAAWFRIHLTSGDLWVPYTD